VRGRDEGSPREAQQAVCPADCNIRRFERTQPCAFCCCLSVSAHAFGPVRIACAPSASRSHCRSGELHAVCAMARPVPSTSTTSSSSDVGSADAPKPGAMADALDKSAHSQMDHAQYGPEAVRWGLPFSKHKSIPDPPPSMDGRPLIPDVHASWFSLLIFLWIQPMMCVLASHRRALTGQAARLSTTARADRPLATRRTS